MEKILWVKFGWSEFYRGGPVDGNYPFIREGGQGHEAWNFLPQSDGTYYCYTPPQAGNSTPWNNDPHGWTVICLAKAPARKGIHIVGWFKDAELAGKYLVRPEGFDPASSVPIDNYYYSIRSRSAWFVPPEYRTDPFSHPSVRQGKYSFLAGPDVEITTNKQKVKSLIVERLRKLAKVAIHNPDTSTAPDRDNDEVDPLGGFGTSEHRKQVETAAVEAAIQHLSKLGYSSISREKDNIGYDLEATHRKDGSLLHVEVKGTSGAELRFFMTTNEYIYRESPEWRLAMIINTLTKPKVYLLSLKEVERDFDLHPMVWKGKRKIAT